MAPRISVSVALVTRNRPRSLERCLESWRRQTVPPDEIVVSDDSDAGTAAETEEIERRYGCLYTRGPGRGLYANRNHASLACGGTHIVSADDDHTHPADYAAVIRDLIAIDPKRVWIFSERMPGDSSSPLACPPELHRSGFGCTPADPSRCAAIADGATVYPRQIFESGLRYDETYAFGGLWYLWGKLLARHGWHITFSDRTFVWHHFWPDQTPGDEGRLENRSQCGSSCSRRPTSSSSGRSGSVDRHCSSRGPRHTVCVACSSPIRSCISESVHASRSRASSARCGSLSAPDARTSSRERSRATSRERPAFHAGPAGAPSSAL
jgi:hypothetical protein